MFIFDTIEQSLYGGVSPDQVPDAARNCFSMVLGRKELDTRIQVKLSDRQVHFFYYDHDYKQSDWGATTVKDYDYLKEVGFITLTRSKDAGNDILDFPQNIANLDLYDEQDSPNDIDNLQIWESIKDCVDQWALVFYDFPFLKKWEKLKKNLKELEEKQGKEAERNKKCDEKKEKKLKELEEKLSKEVERNYKEDVFRCFIRCCFLNFIYEFENRWQSFGDSPLYDSIRDKLRESDVYKMLSAKIHYKQYFYRDGDRILGATLSGNQGKYSYYSQKFADCLMDKRLNKVINPDNYGKGDDKQGWFYNPEYELNRILKKNRSQRRVGVATLKESLVSKTRVFLYLKQIAFFCLKKNRCQRRIGVATLKESLVSKIRVFLYTKHAVFGAMTTCTSRVLFIIAQALMLIGNVLLINASLRFKNDFWHSFFSDWFVKIGLLFLGLVCICIGFSGLINGIRQGKLSSILNAFFPRILVAEAAAWLTIGIAEDLVKSMLWVEKQWVVLCAMVLVLSLVCVIIFGETKQHSPYQRGRNVMKSLLVLNHSVFFALIMGCFMQFVFYNNLLKTSDALSEVVYKDHFKQLERQLDDMEALENSIKEYRIFAREYDFNHKRISGTNAGKTGIKGNISFYNHESLIDSAELKLENRIVMESSMVSTIGKEIHVYHNELVDDITNCAETDSAFKAIISGIKKMTNDEESSVIKENLELINGNLAAKLNLEIIETKNHLSDNNYDTLIRWATANIKTETNTQSDRIQKWVATAKTNKCAMAVSIVNYYFYPNLLLFHTLIVLVLAFITQLIISDKSVTEPL